MGRSLRLPQVDALVARNLRFDMLASACGALYQAVPVNFAGVIGRNLGATPIQLGIFQATAYTGTILTLFSGLWMPRGRLMAYIVLVGIIGRFLLVPAAFMDIPLAFLIIVALSMASVDVTYPVMSDISRRIYPLGQRGQLLARVRMVAVLTALIGASIFGVVLDRFGHRSLLLVGALVGIVGWLVYTRIEVPPGEVETQARFTPWELFHTFLEDRRLLRWMIGGTLWGTGLSFVWPAYPVLLVDKFHASYTQVGILASVVAIASLSSYIIWGRLSDRRSPILVYALAMAGYGLEPLVYLLSPSVEWLVLAAIARGVSGAGLEVAGLNAFTQIAPEGMLVRYQVAITSVIGIRGVFTTMLGSVLFSAPWFGPIPLLITSALLNIAGGLVTGRIRLSSCAVPQPAV